MVDRLGELLVREKLITPEQLKKAIEEQRTTGGRLGYNLAKLGYIKEKDLTTFLSRQYGIPAVDLATTEIDPEVIKLIPEDVANKYQVIPISRTGSTLVLAMADPSKAFVKSRSSAGTPSWYRAISSRRIWTDSAYPMIA